jgi:hypothetical protein
MANSTKSIASICQSQGGNTTATSVNGLYRKQLTPGKSVSVQNMTVKVIRSSNTPVTTQSILRSALIQKIISSTQQAQRPPILQTGRQIEAIDFVEFAIFVVTCVTIISPVFEGRDKLKVLCDL